MNAKIDITNVGLSLPSLPVIKHNFTERNENDELNESEFLANEEFNNRDSASSVSEVNCFLKSFCQVWSAVSLQTNKKMHLFSRVC